MGIHRQTADFPHKGSVIRDFDVFFVASRIKLLNKWSIAGDLIRLDVDMMSL